MAVSLKLGDKPKDRSYPHDIPGDGLLQNGDSDVVAASDGEEGGGE